MDATRTPTPAWLPSCVAPSASSQTGRGRGQRVVGGGGSGGCGKRRDSSGGGGSAAASGVFVGNAAPEVAIQAAAGQALQLLATPHVAHPVACWPAGSRCTTHLTCTRCATCPGSAASATTTFSVGGCGPRAAGTAAHWPAAATEGLSCHRLTCRARASAPLPLAAAGLASGVDAQVRAAVRIGGRHALPPRRCGRPAAAGASPPWMRRCPADCVKQQEPQLDPAGALVQCR